MNETENTTTEVPELSNVAVVGLIVGLSFAASAVGWLAGAGVVKLAEKVVIPRLMESQTPEI